MKRLLISLILMSFYLISIGQDAQPRTPVFEIFTSSTCPPCVQGNKDLKKVLNESDGNYTLVKYQMDFPGVGDPYFTDEGYTRSKFYTLTGVPQLHVDGPNEIWPGSLTQQMVQDIQNEPSKVNLYATVTQDERNLVVNVEVEPTQNVLTPFLKLFVAVVENDTYNNTGTNGETEFESVMKKMLPNAGGQQLPALKLGEPKSFEFTHEFIGDYRLPNNAGDPINHDIEHSVEEFSDLSVLVWVQNRNTKEVLQSTWATLPVNTNKTNKTPNGIVALFPNPVRDFVNVHYQVKQKSAFEVKIFDIKGNQVLRHSLGEKNYGSYIEKVEVSILNEGQYIFSLEDGVRVYQQSFIKVD